jgi:antitoxin MazE
LTWNTSVRIYYVDTKGVNAMVVQFARWGNSLALRIPAAYAKDIGAAEGKCADISSQDGQLIITPVPGPMYDFETLIAGITEENMHGEVDTGPAVGNEF